MNTFKVRITEKGRRCTTLFVSAENRAKAIVIAFKLHKELVNGKGEKICNPIVFSAEDFSGIINPDAPKLLT